MKRTLRVTGVALLFNACAFALNPALDISQYAHTSWKIREGFVKGSIDAIAQTPDGYLWLGTQFGLLRFDGVRNVPWPADQPLPSDRITRLLVTRDGTLWIATLAGLASWKTGKLTHYSELAGRAVFALLEDREGTVWAGAAGRPTGRLCAIRSGTAPKCYGEDGQLGRLVLSLYTYKNDLWVGAGTGLWQWTPQPPKLYQMPDQITEIADMIEGDNGRLWIAIRDGVRQLVGGKVEPYPLTGGGLYNPRRLLRDREGSLWIGTSGQGLLHVHRGRTDAFMSTDGLSGDQVHTVFEDREGNIWAATNNGLDRFRDVAVPAISFLQGLSRSYVGTVVGADDGGVWLGTFGGLNRWKNGKVTVYRKPEGASLTRRAPNPNVREINNSGLPDNNVESMFQDRRGRLWVATPPAVGYFENDRFTPVHSIPGGIINSIVEDAGGNLWIANLADGLFRLSSGGAVERIPWATFGSSGGAAALAPDPLQGGLWIGFPEGGLVYTKDGRNRAYSSAEGLGKGRVTGIRFDRDGTLWASSEGGLSRLKNGRFATLSSRNGLPCDAVHWELSDNANSVWLYMPCGLVRIPRNELEAWSADPNRILKPAVFDSSHGVPSRANAGGYSPRAAKDSDGKLWFPTVDGVSVLDPAYLPSNKFAPPVHIEGITADREPYKISGNVRLPPRVRDLEIEYTALSFAAPEKVQFRYKLEGYERDWHDAGNRREAFYNDLPPRNYRFRVIASNNSGVWNETGAFLDFSVEPAYNQTLWFRLACVAGFVALLAGLYQLRMRQVARQIDMRMEERINERTRIARDLHDTLLQSFQGVLLKFQAVTYQLTDRPEARQTLLNVIEQARDAITEGRDAVHGLRSSTIPANDLARAIGMLGDELRGSQTAAGAPDYSVEVEGKPAELAPLVRDEVFRIAGEAARNAFRHAQASRIEVEIHYDQSQLRLRVRDNGRGIDPDILDQGGRAGHHGLPGMHERARLLAGTLTIWSEVASGSEVELVVPASIAYASPPVTRWRMLLGKVTTRKR